MKIELAQKALKHYFGYSEFRPMQAEIIQAIYAQKDCLVLMPTGGGKSICFQIPAVTLQGVTLVVSPLISLMKDQVDGLLTSGIQAACLNSSLPRSKQRKIESRLLDGQIKLLYVSPERITSPGFYSFLAKLNISLIAIDEAHCISSWGHDFRPGYAKLKQLKVRFNKTPIIALTATADRITRKDIREQLQLDHPQVFLASFDRPNLSLRVMTAGKDKFKKIVAFIDRHAEDSGIIYCLSRKETEQIAGRLRGIGVDAAAYHAGLSTTIRNQVQEAFINERISVICATVAFGMGIDKSNIRWIVHHNLPKNIEAFYQQIGRAGRDGLTSDTLLLYSYKDLRILRKFAAESGQSKLMTEKLKRMQQYAEAVTCRRKLLLSYFNEQMTNDCGNCDVCLQPAKRMDGTKLTQQVLGVILRQNEQVKEVEITRILSLEYQSLSRQDLSKIILQILNLGLIEIAYDEKGYLKITPYGKQVIAGKERVQLVPPKEMQIKPFVNPSAHNKYRKSIQVNNLFQSLKRFRKSLARNMGIPPYLIFDDVVLNHLVNRKPTTLSEMADIPGIGVKKLEQFGTLFLNKLKDFDRFNDQAARKTMEHSSPSNKVLNLFLQGNSTAFIAQQQKISESEVHEMLLAHLQQNTALEANRFVSEWMLNKIEYVVRVTGNNRNLQELYENLNQEIPKYIIKYGLVLLDRRQLIDNTKR